MSKIKGLKEDLAEKRSALSAMDVKLDKSETPATEEEQRSYEDLVNEIKATEKSITFEEVREADASKRATSAKLEADEMRKAAHTAGGSTQGENKDERKAKENFSMYKAIQSLRGNGSLTGIEKELHDEAVSEARGANYTIKGVGLPKWMVEKRTDVDQATSAIAGTVVGSYMSAIRQNSIYDKVIPSSNILNGLTSDVNINQVAKQSLAWASAENSSAADGGANLSKVTLSPVRLTGYVDVSDKLTIQNGDIVLRALMADLGRETANKIDASIFSTANVTDAPGSIAATSGVLTFTETAAYAASSATANGSVYADILLAKQTLANADSLQGNIAFVGHTKLMSDIHKSPKVISVSGAAESAGPGSPLVYYIDGIPFYLTTSNTSNAGVSADFIAGDFSRMFVGFFGGMDMILDPWSVKLNAQDRILVHRYLDTAIPNGAAFVKSTTLLA
jgi:hypothetical protein